MDLDTRLAILAPAARFDACDSFARPGRRSMPRAAAFPADGITAEADADGRTRPVFRVLMSSRCVWNCAYCPLRAGNDIERAALQPEELARLFLPRYERGAVQGLLLSTAVDTSPRAATDQLLDAVEILRTRYRYTGYVHVKLLPGATPGEVERAAGLADRLSINLEAPGPHELARISPERRWEQDLLAPLLLARDWQRQSRLRSGLATQFVVGAAGESDRTLLFTSSYLYRELELRRIYFGAFRPAAGTPLAGAPATPLVRSQRLSQADWLLRHYGFGAGELPYDQAGQLSLHHDPKLAWALAHPEHFPIELNTADADSLLRIPGIGPVAVRRILRLRAIGHFREPAQLKLLGTAATRALDFVTLNGRYFGRDQQARARHYARTTPIAEQLTLWD